MTVYKRIKQSLQKIGFRPIHHFGERDVLLYRTSSNAAGRSIFFIRWSDQNYTAVSKYEDDNIIHCWSFNKESRRSNFSGIRIFKYQNINEKLMEEKIQIPEEYLTESEKKLFDILAYEAHSGMGCSQKTFDEYLSYIK